MSPARGPRPLEVVEAEARERGKLVYRALRDAGPAGLSRDELLAATRLTVEDLLLTTGWLRFKRVDVRFVRATLPGDPNRWVLGTTLPGAWDETV